MKRWFLICTSLIILCGCDSRIGSFEQGTLDMENLIQDINQESNDQTWSMSLLHDHSENEAYLDVYGLSEEDVESYGIFTSVIPAIPDEIAIFEVKDGHMANVKESVIHYLEEKSNDTAYLSSYKDNIRSHKVIEIGNYYIVVIGEDAQAVAQFIEGNA